MTLLWNREEMGHIADSTVKQGRNGTQKVTPLSTDTTGDSTVKQGRNGTQKVTPLCNREEMGHR